MSRRPAIVVATLLTAGLALGGCSAGAVTQTDTIVSQADGSMAQVGDIVLRDISIDAGPTSTVPSGAEAPLRLTIINNGDREDRLVSVTTPYAVSARPEGPTTIPPDNSLRILGDEPGPVGAADPTVRLGGAARIVLTGVTQQLRPGPTYEVTFTFEKAGTVSVPVIVVGEGEAEG